MGNRGTILLGNGEPHGRVWEPQADPQSDLVPMDEEAEDARAPSRPGVELASVKSRTSVSIMFKNKTDIPVRLYWCDYNGEEQSYRTIDPGTTYRQPTYHTHPWTFKPSHKTDRDSNVIIVTDQKRTHVIAATNDSQVSLVSLNRHEYPTPVPDREGNPTALEGPAALPSPTEQAPSPEYSGNIFVPRDVTHDADARIKDLEAQVKDLEGKLAAAEIMESPGDDTDMAAERKRRRGSH